MNFKILLNSATIFVHLQQEPSLSYFRASLLCWLVPGSSLSMFAPKVPGGSGHPTSALCRTLDPVHTLVQAPGPFISLISSLPCPERLGWHGVYPQHPAGNIVESLFCAKHCSERCVCPMLVLSRSQQPWDSGAGISLFCRKGSCTTCPDHIAGKRCNGS